MPTHVLLSLSIGQHSFDSSMMGIQASVATIHAPPGPQLSVFGSSTRDIRSHLCGSLVAPLLFVMLSELTAFIIPNPFRAS